MFRTPLKNSKGVNKPFKSPFSSSSTPNKELAKSGQKNEKPSPVQQSPSSTSSRALEAKRILQLDDNEPERKRPKLMPVDSERLAKVVPENATKSDLMQLKRKIFEMRQELDLLKSRERYAKKHNPKDLKVSIDKWRSSCQNALETICSELRERNGSSKVSEVLDMLGIPETIVHYSAKEDMFT